jgi:UDP-GlcNAc:undecaprenyl-phosphate GlcNAc-1-phosphate transferase
MQTDVFPAIPSLWVFLLGFIVSLAASLLLTPLLRDVAHAGGLLDSSDGDRKIHARDVPRIGGIALVLALGLGITALYLDDRLASIHLSPQLLATAAGAVAMHVLGVVDDLYPMRARYKLFWQICIALAVCAAGLRVNAISLPGMRDVAIPTVVGFALTILWLIGITNSFNLIDGVDGLASGAALFALLTMSAVGIVNHQWGAAWLTMSLSGALIGFLIYNFHPASIFLGDSGSLFLGFVLGATGLMSAQKSSTTVAVAVPVLILGLPMLDTALAIARRFLRGQPIFAPDRGHIHHRLLSQGFTPKQVALTLYCICGALGFAGFVLLTRPELEVILLILLGLGAGLFVHRLKFHEFEELAGTIVRGTSPRKQIQQTVRIREGSVRLAEVPGLDTTFSTLAEVCAAVGFIRAEIHLRKWFLEHGATMLVEESRAREEASVWSWGENHPAETALQVRFPLLSNRGDRIGTINLWQGHAIHEQATSNWRAVSLHLCGVLGLQITSLWHTSVHSFNPAIVETRPQRRSGRTSVVPQ